MFCIRSPGVLENAPDPADTARIGIEQGCAALATPNVPTKLYSSSNSQIGATSCSALFRWASSMGFVITWAIGLLMRCFDGRVLRIYMHIYLYIYVYICISVCKYLDTNAFVQCSVMPRRTPSSDRGLRANGRCLAPRKCVQAFSTARCSVSGAGCATLHRDQRLADRLRARRLVRAARRAALLITSCSAL